MKTDVIFYELIKELPQIFFELIDKPDTNPNIYTFIAPEVKQQSFRLDGIFSTIQGFENEPLYFVELQTYKDEEFYERLFGEIFVYFRQYKPANSDCYAIVIYDKRIHETPPHPRYQVLVEQHLRCIYLNELSTITDDSLTRGIAKLFIEPPTKAISLAQVTLKEIEAMLNLDAFTKTRLYQSILTKTKIEAKLELVPKCVDKGMSVQEIAEFLEVDAEIIKKYLQEQS
jgi:predicted transposase YdaD